MKLLAGLAFGGVNGAVASGGKLGGRGVEAVSLPHSQAVASKMAFTGSLGCGLDIPIQATFFLSPLPLSPLSPSHLPGTQPRATAKVKT